MRPFIIVSNRTPVGRPTAGGLAVALRKVLNTREGSWFGWSGRFADAPGAVRFDQIGSMRVGTIDLTREDHRGYYEGFSNSVLWPAFHHRMDRARIEAGHFESYLKVNRQFAEGLRPHLEPDQLVWVHDYHLIPLAAALRELGVENRIGFFLHIPVPEPEQFAAVPHGGELLRFFCDYDVIGLQAERDVRSMTKLLESVDGGHGGRRPMLRAFPIGTDPESFKGLTETRNGRRTMERVNRALAGRSLIIGVDRLDYCKGLLERIEAYDQLLEHHRRWRRRVHMMQIAPISREAIGQYRDMADALDTACGRLIGRYAEPDWMPLNYVKRTYPQSSLAALYRIARIGLVTPLRDGMNLVAHEYIATQDPEDPGVLVLSKFAGAAELFPEALLVNPHDPVEVAEAMNEALLMPLSERRTRWQALHATVLRNNVEAWAESALNALADTETAAAADGTALDPPPGINSRPDISPARRSSPPIPRDAWR
jgi:trehalose 6-phosphate synthase